ncbi:hypothetical protein [Amnibacterium kyonggiense]|uniref:hypothetical protein n=1 Tax=Amnibacterium kyonggiense TaxID=595671 RepID=UPI00105C6380|nr:hypothetical protein [Amnibacterium kyonggiense]
MRAGIPEPELNAEVHLPGGIVHPDMVWRERLVAVEYEGDGHRDREQFVYDVGRYERMQAAGWTVVRVLPDDLRGALAEQLIRRVRSLLL